MVRRSARSAPAQNDPWVVDRTMSTRTFLSNWTVSRHSRNSFSSLSEMAFFAFGLFKDKKDMPGRASSRKASASPDAAAPREAVVWRCLDATSLNALVELRPAMGAP